VAETDYDAGSMCWSYHDDKSWEQGEGLSWRNPGFVQNGSHPAVCLSWDDAKAYVAWLRKKTSKRYRLLTEAEWEYAARAGTTTRFYFGDEQKDFCRYGNGADQTARSKIAGAQQWTIAPCSDGYSYTAPVGSFLPNGFGLYDMHGNAAQRVEDCEHQFYPGAPSDGSAWTSSGDCNNRITRGGSWSDSPSELRAAFRGLGFTAADRYDNLGFRVARTLSQ